MIRAQRRRHLLVWAVLAPAVVLVVLGAWNARPSGAPAPSGQTP